MAQRFEMHQAAAEAATTHRDARRAARPPRLRRARPRAGRGGGARRRRHRGGDARAVPPRDDRARGRPAGRGAGAVPAGRRVRRPRSGRPWAPYGFDARYQQATDRATSGAGGTRRWRIADPAGRVAAGRRRGAAAHAPDDGRRRPRRRSRAAALRAARRRAGPARRWSPSAPEPPRSSCSAAQGDLAGVWRVHDEVVASAGATWHPEFQARVRLSALVLGQLAVGRPARVPAGRAGGAAAAGGRAGCDVVDVDRRDGVGAAARLRSGGAGLGGAGARRAPPAALAQRLGRAAGRGAAGPPGRPPSTPSTPSATGTRRPAPGPGWPRCSPPPGTPREAAPLVAEARAVAEELGARPLLDELDALGAPGRPAARRPGPTTDLTPREAEILALVADGRSNGEIGKHLFISTKTVSVHVSNILAKLGASGRTEAAAIARRRGLLAD